MAVRGPCRALGCRTYGHRSLPPVGGSDLAIRGSRPGSRGVVVTVSPSVVVGGGSGPAQENVAVAGGRVDLDGVVRFAWAVRALELAADHPVPCLDVEPSSAAVRDTDLELAERTLGSDRATA